MIPAEDGRGTGKGGAAGKLIPLMAPAPHRPSAVVAAGCAAVLVAGCGSSGDNGEAGKDASTVLSDAAAALRGAGGVHLRGDSTGGGSRIVFDLDVAGKGSVSGTFVIDGAHMRLTTTGGNTYLSGAELWDRLDPSGKSTAVLGDRCVLVPPNFPGAAGLLSGLGDLSDVDGIASGIATPKGRPSKGAATTVHGVPALPIRDQESIVFVATRGRPYPLRLESSGTESGHVDLSYPGTIRLRAPTGCIDVSRTGG